MVTKAKAKPRATASKTKVKPSAPRKGASAANSVEGFLEALEHPFKAEILALRSLILAADPSIQEGIKWNAPSFHTSEYFGTFHLRAKQGVQLILHRGAKKRGDSQPQIPDPQGLLTWLGPERASVQFPDLATLRDRRAPFQALIRAWIASV